jgi:hypothetical protein
MPHRWVNGTPSRLSQGCYSVIGGKEIDWAIARISRAFDRKGSPKASAQEPFCPSTCCNYRSVRKNYGIS